MDIKILADKFYEYSLHIRGYSPATIRRYKYVINFYCQFAQLELISAVTGDNLRELFLFGRTKRNWTTNTFIVHYKSLRVFFQWCMQHGHLTSNPIEGIEIPKLERRLPPKLSKQDTLLLLETVYNYPYGHKFLRFRNHAIFSMFVFAGLRKTELLKLKFTDVDIENLSIFIRQGKGSKDRIIPMSSTLAATLQIYVTERHKLKKTCAAFFVSSSRNNGLTNDGLLHIVRNMKQASGLDFCIHKLRHTFATMMIEGGCDIYSLSKMMGHNDIKTTTIYLAASVEHLRIQMTKHPLNVLV